MDIAILGSGNVGAALGLGWAKRGHSVIFGARDPQSEKVRNVIKQCGTNACAKLPSEAVGQAAIIVLALPWAGTLQALEALGDLTGKVVIDCTNPLNADFSDPVIREGSAAEQIAGAIPGAKVVKAFNTVGSGVMRNPLFGEDKALLFMCGDDATAKETTSQLAKDLDFDVVDAGPLSSARYLEQLAMLWIHLAFKQGMGSDFAFKMLRR